MPRRRAEALQAPAHPAQHQPRVIHPTGVYRLDELTALLRLRKSSLAREVREKRLRVAKRCGTYFFVGEDILAWLRSAPTRGVEEPCGGCSASRAP